MQIPFETKQTVAWRMREDDPYPLYQAGELRKSRAIGMVLGVVASVVTMGAALPMLAGGLAMQIAGGVMMAGGVMSGVGAVTGNKKLMKIGGVLSLAGGIGGMVASATGIGAATGSESLANFAKEASSSIDSVFGTNLGTKAAANATAADRAALEAATQSTDAGIINRAMEGAPAVAENALPTATELGTEAATEAAANVSGAAGTSADSAALKLAEEAGAQTASEVGGGIKLAAGEGVKPALANAGDAGSAGGIGAGGGADKVAAAGGDTLFGMNKTELLKVGAGLLEKGAAAAFAPDQEAQMAALTDRYKAETTKLTTENDILAFKRANAGKQVAMIAANDPQMEQKVAAAAAAGHPVAFIPAIGSGGVTPTSGGANMAAPKAQQVAAQTPVRQPTFA